jgi:hypothetical protein
MNASLFDGFLNKLLHCDHQYYKRVLWVIKGIWSGLLVWGT